MRVEASSSHRPHIWASVAIFSLALWLLFGQTQPDATISAWHDDTIAAQHVVLAGQPAGFTALLNKQEPRDTSNIKTAARPASSNETTTKQEPRDTSNIKPAARPAPLTEMINKQERRSTRSMVLASLPQPQDRPWGNPIGSPRAVMTQGYGIGTHAPAEIWGGIDLTIDGSGDGRPDPAATWNAPLYATMSGVIEIRPNSVPAGNHVWIKNKRYKVGYGHLQSFAVKSGQLVERGDLIGYIGATGVATGPHLHYHIWEGGVNVNPLKFGALP